MDERTAKLGYTPQKEVIYNKLLPYSEELDEESQRLFSEIKTNIAKSILLHELKPGTVHWLTNLSRYLKLYGRKFSKNDHIQLIKLLYKIITIPDLELNILQHVVHILTLLLKKKELLSREDLELPWRPLYELYERTMYSPFERLGMFLLPLNLDAGLKGLIQACRIYFSVDATQEMLSEWYPLICPFDTSMSKAISYLELFLPTCLPPEHHDKGFKLWMPDLMKIWQSCYNINPWENHLVWLFARLANDNIGYIDWEQYIPTIFTRLLYSFNLPGSTNKTQVKILLNTGIDTNAVVIWIVSMLGGKSSCQKHIAHFFKAVESYYHPSNNGRWMMKLQRLLHKLPTALVKRLNRERYRQHTWETPIPDSCKLTDKEVTEFVKSMNHVVLLSMFSKGGSTDCALALQNLSILCPEVVIPPVLERLYSSLETLTEPHCLTAAMHCIVAVARTLVRGGSRYAEGPTHVIPLLIGSLPGIDPNDIKKCIVTFQFLSTFTSIITIVDCSRALNYRNDLTEIEQEICFASVQFEDFVLQFMDRVNPEQALKAFVPHFSKLIMALTATEDVTKEETLDNELLFSLLLLSEVVRCDGRQVLKYKNELEKVLYRTVSLNSRQGYLLAGALFRHILRSMVLVYPLDYRSTCVPWERCQNFQDYLPIQDWGKPGDINNLGIQWHIPTKEEIEFVHHLLETFLNSELTKLLEWSRSKITLTRDELQCSLNLVLEGLLGAGFVLPIWKGESFNATESSVPLYCTRVTKDGSTEIHFKDGRNVRQTVAEIIQEVLSHVMESFEDDTKSLFLIIRIYRTLMFYWGATKEEFDSRWKGFHVVKKSLENKLIGYKRHVRTLLIDRTLLQHELRILEKNKTIFTRLHQKLIFDLLGLSTSHYSKIRAKAQEAFHLCLRSYPHCYHVFLEKILSFIRKETNASHEQFKGALYILLGIKQQSLLRVHNWEILKDIWPTIINAPHSEKPSIIKLLEHISSTVLKYSDTIQIEFQVTDDVLNEAKLLWSNEIPLLLEPCPSPTRIEEAKAALLLKNQKNINNYNALVHKLVDLIQNGNLHWRYYHMGLMFLNLLIHYKIELPAPAVKMFVQHLIHDTLNVRQIAISAMCAILKQQKILRKTKEVDPLSVDVSAVPLHSLLPKDVICNNLWLQYNSLTSPRTKQKWENSVFVHKTYIGFYAWPKPLLVYSPDSEQPILDRKREDLSEVEKPIYDAFTQQEFVDKLITYLSIEETKGHDKFDCQRFYMFKGLFRNFGDTFLPYFKSHLEKQVVDLQESVQRCAAEIIAGLLKGSKHWDFEKTSTLEKTLTPILRLALNNITPETVTDWGTCFATSSCNRDPNKLHWLFELLMEDRLKGENGSFLESSCLYILFGVLSQQEWRCFELLHRLLEYLKPHLTHSYQNVREKIGSLVGNIFMYDLAFPNSPCLKLAPQRAPFIQEILSQLSILNIEENIDSPMDEITPFFNNKAGDIKLLEENCTNHVMESGASKEKKKAINLLRTAKYDGNAMKNFLDTAHKAGYNAGSSLGSQNS
ncbi:proteasome activator complex subunit 4-like [Centruroides sculpturatus]|uniref:proteasome activator complex subunit 4-like n=1 Tax=Centruroides sculpturatus TaxID=218467 RepID=UPI000C6DA5B5|nr:proteasome activator complex subunit 4-like [Centruroides sculpturatus]